MFHSKNGLFFERLQDGSVHILRTYDARYVRADNVVLDITLSASEWASVVASVMARGETGDTYRLALDAHNESAEWTPTAEQIRQHRASDHCGGVITPESDEQVISRLRNERKTGKKTFAWQTTSGADLR